MVNFEILVSREASSEPPPQQPHGQPGQPLSTPLTITHPPPKPTRLPGEISDAHELKRLLETSSVVAFDAAIRSGQDQTKHKLLDVGFAYLPEVPQGPLQHKITSLKAFVDQCKPEISFLRSHDEPQRGEKFFWGETEVFHDAGEIVHLVQKMKARTKKSLMLVVFAHNTETTVIARDFPEAAPCFSSWVDLQELAANMESSGVIDSNFPSLESVMHTLGLYDYTNRCHNSGNDALRTLALLVSLARISNTGEKLRIIKAPKKPQPILANPPKEPQPVLANLLRRGRKDDQSNQDRQSRESAPSPEPRGPLDSMDESEDVAAPASLQGGGLVSPGVLRGVKRPNPFHDTNHAPKRRKIDVVETVRYERGGRIEGAQSAASTEVDVSLLQEMFRSFSIAE